MTITHLAIASSFLSSPMKIRPKFLSVSLRSLAVCGGLLALAAVSIPSIAAEQPVMINAGGGGHIHPSICRTKDGTLVVVFKSSNNFLVSSRSTDQGKTWSTPAPIPASQKRPDIIREAPKWECYPGTADVLPDDRILVTWNYIADDKAKDGRYERGLLYCLSSDQGKTWTEQKLIGPIDGKHLGAVRHNVIPWKGGRWLLPLREGPPRLFNPKTGELTVFKVASSDAPTPEGKEHSFQQIVRTPKGTLLAMGMVMLRSTDDGSTWKLVKGFRKVPDITPAEGRDQAEGRYLTVLKDGRLLVSWGINKGNKGLSYNFSADDGLTWNNDQTVVLLPELDIQARYYSVRTIQVDDQHIGSVFLNSGVKYVKARIDRVAK